jgi:hypothetical protein
MSKAVSYSRMSLYKKCPASYEWQYVLGHKQPFVPGSAASRGLDIHQSIEDWYKGEGDLSPEIPPKMVDKLAHTYEDVQEGRCTAHPEFEFAINKGWELTGFDDDDAVIRGYMDNLFLYEDKVLIHEYKTGKEYSEHEDQKLLYGIIALTLWHQYSEVLIEGIYLDLKKVVPTRISRTFLRKMQGVWARDIAKLEIPMYPARPGMHCRWCPKSSKKEGGTCQLG